MHKPSLIFAAVMVALSWVAPNLRAGEVSFAIDKAQNKVYVTFDGVIEKGDAQKIRDAIAAHRYFYLWSNGLAVNSDGGDVAEAIKIGDLVRRSGWRVDVQKEGVCASACFLIYVAGPIRYSEGKVVIHRPYFIMDGAEGKDAYLIEEGYRSTISEVRSYLSAQLVPSYLIDLMMSKDSSEGYTLTPQDIANIGFFSPSVDEYQVQQCKLPTGHLASKEEVVEVGKCRDKYLLQARIEFLYGAEYPVAAKAVGLLDAELRSLPARYGLGSAAYHDHLLYVQQIVDTLPPDKWASAFSTENRK